MGTFRADSKRNNFVEFDCWLITQTERAFLVSSDESEDDKQWIPKDTCEFDEEDLPDSLPAVMQLRVKEEMLLKKGFL